MANRTALEVSEVRKRLRAAIEHSRRAAAARRAEMDEAQAAYDRFLRDTAGPVVQMLANVLRGEGLPFTLFTPAGGLRLASGRSGDDYLELALETAGPHPVALLRVSRTRGRRVMQHERPIRGEERIDQLTEEDVLNALLEEIGPLVER